MDAGSCLTIRVTLGQPYKFHIFIFLSICYKNNIHGKGFYEEKQFLEKKKVEIERDRVGPDPDRELVSTSHVSRGVLGEKTVDLYFGHFRIWSS